jgi:H+/gluconate symporter-like permease
MDMLGLVISLFGLMYLAYRGVNVLLLAPLMAILAVVFHTSTPFMATLTQIYMPAVGGYVVKYLPLFLLGSLFGKLMSETGFAQVIAQKTSQTLGAKHALLAVVVSCALLTYGGVSLFVVAFCMEPLAVSLFREANLPRRFIPGSIAVGSFTFTMTALPGTPAIQNAIPMPYFGTDAFAAPILGLIAALIMGVGGTLWMNGRVHRAVKQGEHFTEKDKKDPTQIYSVASASFFLSILPLLIVFIGNYAFTKVLLPSLDHTYLSLPQYGSITLDKIVGTWGLMLSLILAIFFLFLVGYKRLHSPLEAINRGTLDCMLPVFNTASEVGYGQVIASLSSFTVIKEFVLGLFPSYPLISEAVSINILAGITGSASGGLSIALESLGSSYLEMAKNLSISPELLHRVASLSCGGFDTLPHNGAVITLLGICGMNHKSSYFDIFMVAVAIPVLATTTVVILGSTLGSF